MADADAAMARGEFFEAQKMYRKIYGRLTKREERPLRGEVAYKLADCYRRLNMSARAAASYQNAIRYQYPDSMAFYWLGRSLQADGKYPQAAEAYRTFLEWQPDSYLAKEGLKGCQQAIAAKQGKATRYIVKNAKLFNSRRADFAPMYLDKQLDQLYFTTTNEKVTGNNRSEITGMKKSDIWFVKKNARRSDHVPDDGAPLRDVANFCRDIHLETQRCVMVRAGQVRDNRRHHLGDGSSVGISRRQVPVLHLRHAGRIWW